MLLRHPVRVDFDPSVKEHRFAVRSFMKRNAWADSPLKFNYDPSFGSIAEQVHVKLLQWYMDNDKEAE